MKAMKLYLLALLALPLSAQQIIPAVSGDGGVGGYIYTSPALQMLPAPYNSMRAGIAFSYDLAEPNGSCQVTLLLIENRPFGPNPATDSGPGTRLFTATVQGVPSPPIDIFSAIGDLHPYQLTLPPAAVKDAHLRIALKAIKGNAVLSGLQISCTPNAAWQCSGIIGSSVVTIPATPTTPEHTQTNIQDCTGFYLFQITQTDGTVLKVLGYVPDSSFALGPQWTQVKLP